MDKNINIGYKLNVKRKPNTVYKIWCTIKYEGHWHGTQTKPYSISTGITPKLFAAYFRKKRSSISVSDLKASF